jgi:hypothetical protein
VSKIDAMLRTEAGVGRIAPTVTKSRELVLIMLAFLELDCESDKLDRDG